MTTLRDRPNTALLVVDTQTGVVAGAHQRDAVVANIGRLVDRARAARVPVVWVQHSAEPLVPGSAEWQIAPELAPAGSEARVEKSYADAFEESALESTLAASGVGRLVVAGAETDECIRATLHGAVVRGYDAILVADAHTTGDHSQWGAPSPEAVIAHTNLYWADHKAPGREAGTITTDEADFATI